MIIRREKVVNKLHQRNMGLKYTNFFFIFAVALFQNIVLYCVVEVEKKNT